MSLTLTKGQKLSLTKEVPGGAALTSATLGLGWRTTGTVDLDASCVLLGADGSIADTVWFRHEDSADGSVRHSGDELSGGSGADDEQIVVHLDRVASSVERIVFTVTSFLSQPFTEVESAFVRLVDNKTGNELCRFDLAGKVDATAMIMAQLVRDGSDWSFAAIGEPARGNTVKKLVPRIVELTK